MAKAKYAPEQILSLLRLGPPRARWMLAAVASAAENVGEHSESAIIDAIWPLVRRGHVHILDDVLLNRAFLRLKFQSSDHQRACFRAPGDQTSVGRVPYKPNVVTGAEYSSSNRSSSLEEARVPLK
jgi:hypothetical protein